MSWGAIHAEPQKNYGFASICVLVVSRQTGKAYIVTLQLIRPFEFGSLYSKERWEARITHLDDKTYQTLERQDLSDENLIPACFALVKDRERGTGYIPLAALVLNDGLYSVTDRMHQVLRNDQTKEIQKNIMPIYGPGQALLFVINDKITNSSLIGCLDSLERSYRIV